MFIIASFLLSLNACGFKADPYYEKEAPASDKNVKFTITDKKFPIQDTNESCE